MFSWSGDELIVQTKWRGVLIKITLEQQAWIGQSLLTNCQMMQTNCKINSVKDNILVKDCLKPTQESSDSLEKVIFIVLSITIN